MIAKWITGLGLAAVLILAGVCWIVGYQSKSGPILDAVAVENTTGYQVKAVDSVVSVPSVSRSAEAEHASVPQSIGRIEAVAVRNGSAEDIARLERIEAGVEVSEIKAALEFLRSQGDTGRESELAGNLVRQWAESDVEQAAQWVEKMPAGEGRQRAVNDVAILWANKDAAGAVSWIGQLPEGEERDGALTCAVYEIVRTEPEVAMEIAVKLPVSKNGDQLVQHIALQWAANNPQGAAEWAEELPDEPMKERVQANIATAWGEKDPVHAAQYAVLSIKPGKAQDDAVVGIVQRWAQRDPVAAANWVEAFPSGTLSETAAENILKLWPADDGVIFGVGIRNGERAVFELK